MNAIPGQPNAFSFVLAATNLMNATSDFSPMATGFQGASDWLFERCEMHAFTSYEGISAKAMAIDGAPNFTAINGNFAAANGFIIQAYGNIEGATFINTSFYTDQGPPATNVIGSVHFANISGLTMMNPNITLGPAPVIAISNGSVSGRVFPGTGIPFNTTTAAGLTIYN